MIVRQYGSRVESVTPNFVAHAINEVGFRRDHAWSMPTDEFFASHERMGGQEIEARATGDVQTHVETELLAELRAQLDAAEAAAGDSGVLLIESGARDHPKLRHKQRTIVVRGENRFAFEASIDPPLKVGIFRRVPA